jgi:hypothetical protein
MSRRLTICAVWFVAFFCLHELAWSLVGSPRVLGLAIGGLAAAFMWVDPLHLARPATTVQPDTRSLAPDVGPR